MSKVVVLGVEGEEGFWLVDFEAGTLTKIDDGADDSFAFAARSRQSGEPVVRGVKFAVLADNGEEPASGLFDRGPTAAPRVHGVKFAVVTNNGEDPAGGHVDRGLSRKPAVQGQECSVMTHTGHGVASGHYDRGAVTRGIDVALMASNGSASGGFMDRGPE
jgi:hypothetical protein